MYIMVCHSPYNTGPPVSGFTLMFVVVLFATVHDESSNPGCISGKLSLNFHPVNFGTFTFFDAALCVSWPVSVPCPSRRTATFAPFHVTALTAEGATIVSGTDAFRSPRSASVLPEIVALRTRFGPPTSTVVFVPNCQKLSSPGTVFFVADFTAGAQNDAAVTGSANSTSCVVESQRVMRPLDPGVMLTVVMPRPAVELVKCTREEEVRVPVPVRVVANS